MRNRLTYKQKFKWLGGVALLSLLLCWQLGVSKTFREWTTYRQSLDNAIGGSNGASILAMQPLQAHEAAVSALYNRYLLDTMSSEKNLLSIAGNFCRANNLQLKEYRPLPPARSDSVSVLTRIVRVEGGYIRCLKFLYELEKVRGAGRVSAVEFRSYKDTRDKVQRLECTIYVQNLIN